MQKKPLMLGGLGGAITVILVWLLNSFAGIEVPNEVAQAFSVIITVALTLMGVNLEKKDAHDPVYDDVGAESFYPDGVHSEGADDEAGNSSSGSSGR